MIGFIKRLLPSPLKNWIKKSILRGSITPQLTQNNEFKNCSVCKIKTIIRPFPYHIYFQKFYEHGFEFSPFMFETLNLKHYQCANCGASDRDRLIALYLNEVLPLQKKNAKLLDFAPSKPLQKFIKNFDIQYRSADLYMEGVDDRVDITSMKIYDDKTFDIFICSHVLEHIEEDRLALKELNRILRPNGIGLVLVPILLNIDKSIENKSYLKSEHLRWKYFGQGDHVRLYSKNDFVDRLANNGFYVEELGVDYFSEDLFKKNGIDLKSVLYVVKKRND